MTPETLVRATPETKPCVRCRVAINAASGRCTLCGAGQRVRRRGTRVIAAGAVAGLALVAVLVAVLSGGSGGGETQFRLYKAGQLVTFVPVGWSGGQIASAPGVSRAVFADPVDTRRRLTVVAERMVQLPALRRARRIRVLALSNGGYRQHFFGRIFFPGGRPAWLLTYDSDDSSHAVYVYSACMPSVAMTVELRAPRRSDLQSALEQIPASAGPRC